MICLEPISKVVFKQNLHTSQMNKPEKILGFVFVTRNNTAVVLKPGVESLYLPSPLVTAQYSAVLRFWTNPASPMRRYKRNSFLSQFFVQRITIVSFIGNKYRGSFLCNSFSQSCFNQSNFGWGSGFDHNSDRQALRIANSHDFTAFSSFCRAYLFPPFLALAKVPSIKHSLSESLPLR